MASAESTTHLISWKRLDGIDLLRGLAIFFVLMNHVNVRLFLAKVPYTQFLPAQLLHILIWNAQLGVHMFFVISGFLITSITIRRWGSLSQVHVRDFYRFRFARIAPLLLLLLAVLCGLHLANVHDYVVPARTGGLGPALFSALTFNLNELEIHRGYLPGSWDVLWSLSVEEMFYLFFPILCLLFAGNRLFGRGKLFIAILLTFVVLGPFGRTLFTHGNDLAVEKSYLGGMEGIALGCLTALIVAHKRFSPRTLLLLNIGGGTLVAVGLIFSWQFYRDWLGKTGLNFTFLAVATCIFIAGVAQSQWRSPRVLMPMVKMGRYSYEIYLTHVFVVFTLLHLFLRAGKAISLVPVYFLLTVAISALLGAAVANLYSEPMNRFLRSKSGKFDTKTPSTMYEPASLQDGTVTPSNT